MVSKEEEEELIWRESQGFAVADNEMQVPLRTLGRDMM